MIPIMIVLISTIATQRVSSMTIPAMTTMMIIAIVLTTATQQVSREITLPSNLGIQIVLLRMEGCKQSFGIVDTNNLGLGVEKGATLYFTGRDVKNDKNTGVDVNMIAIWWII